MLQQAGRLARQHATCLAPILASLPCARHVLYSTNPAANPLPPNPSLADFIHQAASMQSHTPSPPAVPAQPLPGVDGATGHELQPALSATPSRNVYIETYGCQMNVSDTEVLLSVLHTAGYSQVADPLAADLVLINTCAVRDNAEQRVWARLGWFKHCREQRRRRGEYVVDLVQSHNRSHARIMAGHPRWWVCLDAWQSV